MDIQILLIPQQLKTYSQVFIIAREVEQGLEKKNHSQMKNQALKRPFQQMDRGGPVRATRALMTKRPFQPAPLQVIRPSQGCNYCQKPGHTQENSRREMGYAWHVAPVTTRWKVIHKEIRNDDLGLACTPSTDNIKKLRTSNRKAPLLPRQQVFRPV